MQSPRRQEYGKLSNAGTGSYLGRMVYKRCAGPDDAARDAEPQVRQLKPAPLAQSAERLHGKEKVYGSIP